MCVVNGNNAEMIDEELDLSDDAGGGWNRSPIRRVVGLGHQAEHLVDGMERCQHMHSKDPNSPDVDLHESSKDRQ